MTDLQQNDLRFSDPELLIQVSILEGLHKIEASVTGSSSEGGRIGNAHFGSGRRTIDLILNNQGYRIIIEHDQTQ